MLSATQTCLMCNVPLTFHQARKGKLCDNPQCRWNYSRIPPRQLCTVCARPLSIREFAARSCENGECRRALFAAKRERERAERAILLVQARKLRDEHVEQTCGPRDPQAGSSSIQKAETYSLVVVPSFSAPVTRLPAHRRDALREHVMKVIDEALAGSGSIPSAAPRAPTAPMTGAMPAILGRACAMCQGSCCRCGAEHAYLSAATIRRFMDAHPELGPGDVLAVYMDRVSDETYERSCIYHGASGCGLSREMRSDTCNQYFCEELKEYLRATPNASQMRAFIATARDGVLMETKFVEEAVA